MSGQHTPGPWVVRDADTMCPVIDSPNIGKGYWASLATATQRDPHPREGGGISMEMARANARLIAAAPDLLEALEPFAHFAEAVIRFSASHGNFPKDGPIYVLHGHGLEQREITVEHFKRALAIIAKARGEK